MAPTPPPRARPHQSTHFCPTSWWVYPAASTIFFMYPLVSIFRPTFVQIVPTFVHLRTAETERKSTSTSPHGRTSNSLGTSQNPLRTFGGVGMYFPLFFVDIYTHTYLRVANCLDMLLLPSRVGVCTRRVLCVCCVCVCCLLYTSSEPTRPY